MQKRKINLLPRGRCSFVRVDERSVATPCFCPRRATPPLPPPFGPLDSPTLDPARLLQASVRLLGWKVKS